MPKDDIFSLHVQVGNKYLEENVINEKVFVAWDVNAPETISEKISDINGVQEYPLTPYKIVIETFDECLIHWFKIFVDGQQVASRPIFGAYKCIFSGIYDKGTIREFHFSLPVLTEEKNQRLPDDQQSLIGTITASAFRCSQTNETFIQKQKENKFSSSYRVASKSDNHSGVCTILKSSVVKRNQNQRKPHRRVLIGEHLSNLSVLYVPLNQISGSIPCDPPQSSNMLKSEPSVAVSNTYTSEQLEPSTVMSPVSIKLSKSFIENNISNDLTNSPRHLMVKSECKVEVATPGKCNNCYTSLNCKSSSSNHTILSPAKPVCQKIQPANGKVDLKSEVIVIDDDDENDDEYVVVVDESDADDDVIWYGDDSCFFVDVEPQDIPMIDLCNDTTMLSHE